MKLKKLYIFLLFVLAACTSSRNAVSTCFIKEIEQLQTYVRFLASDSLKGRFPGMPESDVAANYIRDELQSFGYKPLTNNGLQTFGMVVPQRMGKKNTFFIGGKEYQPGKDFTVLSISSSDSVSAKVSFVGYGLYIDHEGLKRNDYLNIDVTNRWVLMLLGAPNSKYDLYSHYQMKAVTARDKGAKGVIFVAESAVDKDAELIPFALHEASIGIPCLQVTGEIVDEYMHKDSRNLAAVEKNPANDRNCISCESDYIVTATTDIESISANTGNVVMKLEGHDPVLKNESIIVGAHYDHLGFGRQVPGSRHPAEHAIHNGADDNASGVALVMLLAKKLAKQKERLKRSIVVVLFGAEEQGFTGSKYFVSNAPEGVGKMTVMLNFDMVGRLNAERNVQISGVDTFEQGEDIVTSAGNLDSLRLTLSEGGFGPSDHASFYAKQIPVLYFTTGVHMDYHSPYDTVEKIDYKGIRSIELLAEDIVKRLANLSAAPTYQQAKPSRNNVTLYKQTTTNNSKERL